MKTNETKNEQFFVVKQGKVAGPFSLDELMAMQLSATDFIKVEGAADFQELREIPELCRKLSIQHEPTAPQYFASMDMRLLAWAIDFFVVFAAICIFIVVPVLVFGAEDSRMQMIIMGLLALIPVQFFMSVIMECSQRQGTFGKILINIKVCDTAGLPIGFWKAFLRNCYKVIGFLSAGIGFFVGFFDRKQQCLHDKLAGTLVIKDRLV